ncbi:MAG: hypothetical protein D4R65_10165 [Verrucomicrobiaceae bacterium]|nr:MAG: hypothetical protein D4R65_10165 [Verrucomicrobiaceae bacterium]
MDNGTASLKLNLQVWGCSLTVLLAGLFADACPASGDAEMPPSLTDLSDQVTLAAKHDQEGSWVELRSDAPFSEKDFAIGRVADMDSFVSCFRGRSSCWMESLAGHSIPEVPPETQFLLIHLRNGKYLAMIALVDGSFRSSLSGGTDGRLHLITESGDSRTKTDRVTGLYLEEGGDPFKLIRSAAARVREQSGAVNSAPRMPDFARFLGWCSWNAFYEKVSHDGVMEIMRKFEEGGVSPGFVILDDGWQCAADRLLTGYEANRERFPDGLAATVRKLKQTHNVSRVLVWQAFNGYWRGTDPQTLPDLGIEMITPRIPARFTGVDAAPSGKHDATVTRTFYPPIYQKPVAEPDLDKFFSAYHGFLRSQGVDGVKIDAMTWIETLGEDRGGRVRAMKGLVGATERSEKTLFDSNVIWCSSCSNDCILQAPRSAIMRTSSDFFPDKPESHGRHLINNALNSLWMGEFIIPDWDMFQTRHPSGAFHAASRAISGGPVYISDEPGGTDFGLLSKLALSDRTVPLCLGPARPTADSLFVDPSREPALFKIFNLNPAGGGVLGVFNCGHNPVADTPVNGDVCVDNVSGLSGEEFAVFRHQEGSLTRIARSNRLPLALRELEFELFTLAPVSDGFAAIGLADKFNSGGCVTAIRRTHPGRIEIDLRDGGEFLAWSKILPRTVSMNGQELAFQFDPKSHSLRVDIPRGHPGTLVVGLIPNK